MIERIKNAIIQLLHHQGDPQPRITLNKFLSDQMKKEYSGLSAPFSQVEGITIEHYFLLQRLERV